MMQVEYKGALQRKERYDVPFYTSKAYSASYELRLMWAILYFICVYGLLMPVSWFRYPDWLWRAGWYYNDRKEIRRDFKTRLEMEDLVEEFERDDEVEGSIVWTSMPESGGTVIEKWTQKR